jgi:S1-C subfamily serine protease
VPRGTVEDQGAAGPSRPGADAAAGIDRPEATGLGRSVWRQPALRWWLAAGAAVALAVASLVVSLRARSGPAVSPSTAASIADARVGKAISDLQAAPPDAVAVYNQVAPAVVVVQSSGAPGGAGSLGSGVVVSNTGEILTALHVVDRATSVKVTFSDGTQSSATVRTSDPAHDIATLAPSRLPAVVVTAVLGGGVRVGDDAYVVGHPLGLVDTLTAGVISGLDRTFEVDNTRSLTGLIQFDTAVDPGSSGGPLLNRRGQVIGIVTGLANPAGQDDFAGIGFAVPIATAGGAAGIPNK